MAFITVQKGSHAFSKGIQEIRMGAHLAAGRGTSRGVYISVSSPLIDQVGWKKITQEDKVRSVCACLLREGVGDDAGFLMLIEDDGSAKPYAIGTSNAGSRAFTMTISLSKLKHYVLNEVPTPTEAVEYTIDEKEHSILIQCPDWLRYNSLSYTPPPRIPAQEAKKIVPPTRAVASGVKEIVKEVAKEFPFPNRKVRRAAVSAVTKSMQ